MWRWLHKHLVTVHSYADDTQLYASCQVPDGSTLTANLLYCITSIADWMTSNPLKLIAEKTQFIWLDSSYYTASVSRLPAAPLWFQTTVYRTWAWHLTRSSPYDTMSIMQCSCFFQLRQLCSVWRSLTDEALHTLAHTFIASRVDDCNALLYGVTNGVIRRLQSVLHAAAWLITSIRRYEHITLTLRDTLHWLPISQRITFKIALTMCDCSRSRCPKYFGDVYTVVHIVAACSRLRSADHGDIVLPCIQSTHFGCRSFRMCGPTNWNKLPHDLQSTDTREQFKSSLKSWNLSVRTAGGASDRHWLKVPYKWTYLLFAIRGHVIRKLLITWKYWSYLDAVSHDTSWFYKFNKCGCVYLDL